MVDLLSLIPPGSGMQFRVADSINDRGEIAVQGILSNGDYRAILLIPCDENHSGVEGCDYDLVDATKVASRANTPGRRVYNRAMTPSAVRPRTPFNIFQQRRFNGTSRVVGPSN